MRSCDDCPKGAHEGGSDQGIPRRTVLGVVGATTLVACGGGGGGTSGGGSGAIDAGAVSMFPMNTWTAVGTGSRGVIVAHDAGGLFAYTSVCTHEACNIAITDASTGAAACPCHGSHYDGNGNVTSPPAPRPLNHFAVTVASGQVSVDPTMVVPASTRTPAA